MLDNLRFEQICSYILLVINDCWDQVTFTIERGNGTGDMDLTR